MYKVSELLGKPLIDTFDAKIVGTVSNIYFDEGLVDALFLCVTDEEMNQSFLSVGDVKSLHGEAVTVQRFYAVNPPPCTKNPINLPAYDQSGKSLGKIRDLVLQDRRVQKIVCEKGCFERSDLLSHSPSLLIFRREKEANQT